MHCVARNGFTGEQSKQISDKTDTARAQGRGSGGGPALGNRIGGWDRLKERHCLLRTGRQWGATDGFSTMEWQI